MTPPDFRAPGRGPGGAASTDGIWDIPLFTITPEELAEISALVYDKFGIYLKPERRAFVTSRLHPVLMAGGFKSVRAYLDYLRTDVTGYALSELANQITTIHTSFFREKPHFDFLYQTVLPELEEKRGAARDLRIWSAACATGEEAYALSMTLHRYFGARYPSWTAGVLATDISAMALSRAKDGVYQPRSLKTVPEEMLVFFDALPNGNYRVVESVRRDVTFRRFNLVNPTYPFKKPFDVVFCRNVMIYFDDRVRNRLLERMAENIAPGGFLFVGHSETFGKNDNFTQLQPAVYRRAAP